MGHLVQGWMALLGAGFSTLELVLPLKKVDIQPLKKFYAYGAKTRGGHKLNVCLGVVGKWAHPLVLPWFRACLMCCRCRIFGLRLHSRTDWMYCQAQH